MQNRSETNQFIEAMSELQYYVDETEAYQKGKTGDSKREEKKTAKASEYESKDPIPRAETMKEDPADENPKEDTEQENPNKKIQKEKQETDEIKKDPEQKEDEKDVSQEKSSDSKADEEGKTFLPTVTHLEKHVPGKHHGMPRYKEYDPAAPTVGVEAVREAVEAMHELQMLQRNHYPYLLVCIKDDGSRTQKKFRTLVQAQEQMEEEMKMYIDQVDPIDSSKVIYRDDGSGAHDFEPTPENELNPDGTFKHPSEVDGTLHTLREDTKGIVYFEAKNDTARWDILDTDEAEIGDHPDDPEFEAFIKKAIEEANERNSKKNRNENKKKKKFF